MSLERLFEVAPLPWSYSGRAAVYSADGVMHVYDVRGWGRLTGYGATGLRLSHGEACAIQDVAGRLAAAGPELMKLCQAAQMALRSYQYGNASPDLAESVADQIEALLAGIRAEENVPCGNCGVYRTVRPGGLVERCTNCGDDEFVPGLHGYGP